MFKFPHFMHFLKFVIALLVGAVGSVSAAPLTTPAATACLASLPNTSFFVSFGKMINVSAQSLKIECGIPKIAGPGGFRLWIDGINPNPASPLECQVNDHKFDGSTFQVKFVSIAAAKGKFDVPVSFESIEANFDYLLVSCNVPISGQLSGFAVEAL